MKRRTTKSLKKRTKPDLPHATGMSVSLARLMKLKLILQTLPQDHVFNPRIPQTPRPPRRNESFFSENGSPVDPSAIVPHEDDLPDPDEMERQAEAESLRSRGSRSVNSGRSMHRKPSIVFRRNVEDEPEDDGASVIPLSDGRSISFNPMNLTPGRIEQELNQGGFLNEEEKRAVRDKVQQEAVKALQRQMDRWKGL